MYFKIYNFYHVHALQVLAHFLWAHLLLHLPLLLNLLHLFDGNSSLQDCWTGDDPQMQWDDGQYPAAQFVMHHSFIPG